MIGHDPTLGDDNQLAADLAGIFSRRDAVEFGITVSAVERGLRAAGCRLWASGFELWASAFGLRLLAESGAHKQEIPPR
jgi:hypothetical protein